MKNRVLIGTVTLEKDLIMLNTSYQYAASFEELNIPKGEYQIWADESDLHRRKDGHLYADSMFIEYKGTFTRGNVGNKIGSNSEYRPFLSGYNIAQWFLNKHNYLEKEWWAKEFILDNSWTIIVDDFISFDGSRVMMLDIVLKDNAELKYL